MNVTGNLKKTTDMIWTRPLNGRQSLAEEDFAMDSAWQEEKWKTAIIMEEPSDELHEKQNHGRSYFVQKWIDGCQLYR